MWHGVYLSVRLTSRQKLDEQNPILRKQYISLFDKDILLFLKQVEYLDPIHSIHFLAFKLSKRSIADFSYVGMPCHIEVFLDFFLDPSRSGKYHLTPQHHADIVLWMIKYYDPFPKSLFVRRFQYEDRCPKIFAGHIIGRIGEKDPADQLRNQTMTLPIGIHLSHASRCAERLIEILRSYNPDTFPLMSYVGVRGIVLQYYS